MDQLDSGIVFLYDVGGVCRAGSSYVGAGVWCSAEAARVGGLVSVSECEFAIIKLSPDEFEELVGLVGRVLSACGDLCGCGVEACSVFGSL